MGILAAKQGRLCEIYKLRMNSVNENEFVHEEESCGTANFAVREAFGPDPGTCLPHHCGKPQRINTASQKASS